MILNHFLPNKELKERFVTKTKLNSPESTHVLQRQHKGLIQSQITGKSNVCSTVVQGKQQRQFQSCTEGPDMRETFPYPVDTMTHHDDVIKWKHFPSYWPFVRGNHRWPVNSPHKIQWRGALMLSFICAWISNGMNNREAIWHAIALVSRHSDSSSVFNVYEYLYVYIFIYIFICIYSFMYWKSRTSDLLVLMLFVVQCTDYKYNFLTLTLTLNLLWRHCKVTSQLTWAYWMCGMCHLRCSSTLEALELTSSYIEYRVFAEYSPFLPACANIALHYVDFNLSSLAFNRVH